MRRPVFTVEYYIDDVKLFEKYFCYETDARNEFDKMLAYYRAKLVAKKQVIILRYKSTPLHIEIF